ncbi:MAG: ORF6N domain-containing protein [Thermodesulfobacteriota bacterium]|nr:ORF6N domain-containing protein [Thermodesulfobacteriota bacterium]
MSEKRPIIPIEQIEQRILLIRGQKVMLDADLAELYGVTTKRLNEQVKRNRNRFPQDFMFRLTAKEKAEVVANCDHLVKLKFSPALPNAFTEHGAIMVASVLNTKRAIEVSVFVVRAFIKLREMLATHKELAHKLVELERRLESHDEAIQSLFSAIRQLMTPPETKRRPIGFRAGDPDNGK